MRPSTTSTSSQSNCPKTAHRPIIRQPSYLLTAFCLCLPFASITVRAWREQGPPQLMAAGGYDHGGGGYGGHHNGMEVPSPLRYRSTPTLFLDAYRLHCHSCMSPYLEDQFQYISHLYRRPMVFTDKCDHGQFDWRYVRSKNCTDACVTLRMNDRVGGRRRFGFMRGCLSDIIHHNRTAVRFGELSRTSKSGASICTAIRLRDLFVSSDRYGFDPHDHVDLCACIRPNCNSSSATRPNKLAIGVCLALLTMLSVIIGGLEGNSLEVGSSVRKKGDLPHHVGRESSLPLAIINEDELLLRPWHRKGWQNGFGEI